jgi:hypothetical protein
MKKFFLICLLLISSITIFSQANFGWNLVLEGTKYKTVMPEGTEFFGLQQEGKKINLKDFDKYGIIIGEPIFMIDNFKGGVLAFDPKGRLIFIENKKTIQQVVGYEYLTVGSIKEDINTLDGTVYKTGMYVLIVDQSLEKNTFTVLLPNNKKLDFPQNKIFLIRDLYSQLIDQLKFKDVTY